MAKRKLKRSPSPTAEKPKCGLIMPISGSKEYKASHWSDVKRIIEESLSEKFAVELVSTSDEVGVIHKRIVQNLYDNPIVVCDVSSLNPNCMLELGMRLAFDMPTVLIADDSTPFKFDTSPIDHLIYPRDLRFYDVKEFQEQLVKRVVATEGMRAKDPKATVFLGHFVEYTRKEIPNEEIGAWDLVLKKLDLMEKRISQIKQAERPRLRDARALPSMCLLTYLGQLSALDVKRLEALGGVSEVKIVNGDTSVLAEKASVAAIDKFIESTELIPFNMEEFGL